ncbi:MAG: hypothetical protein DRQ49_18020 [Gammaproteobacteria bacterium]|nr:MAG: hypothetical protein DRQ49_18020 [Gammaproteobacteria bacterium]RKZ74658.1 MAG: hypothetical protein DRQ57_10340 [Gammaproteobacteria bacterium]
MFSDFKTKTDLERLGYKIKERDLSLPEENCMNDETYDNIQLFVKLFYSNEEAVKALILTPIFVYIIKLLEDKYSILYEEYIQADDDLRGRCDIIVSRVEDDDTNDTLGDKPLLVIEAKKKTVEEALSQCSAELIALKKLGKEVQYGIISTGDDWIFIEIFPDKNLVYQHNRKFYLSDLRHLVNIIFGILKNG